MTGGRGEPRGVGGGGWRHAPRGRGGAGPPGGLEQSGRGEANLSRRRRRRRRFCLFLLPPAPGNRQPRPRCACGVPPPVRGSLSLPAAALGRVEGLPFPSGVRPRSFPPPPIPPSERGAAGERLGASPFRPLPRYSPPPPPTFTRHNLTGGCCRPLPPRPARPPLPAVRAGPGQRRAPAARAALGSCP